jgi:hypothetical protein
MKIQNKISIISIAIMLVIMLGWQDVKALTIEQIMQQKHDYFNNVFWSGFQGDCRGELGIAEDQLLTGEDMMNCKQAQAAWVDAAIPDTPLIDMHKVDNVKLYLMAVVENSPLPK